MKPSLAFPIPHTPEFDVNRIKNISEKYLDISYASEKEHVLDLYLPEKKKEEYPLSSTYMREPLSLGANGIKEWKVCSQRCRKAMRLPVLIIERQIR